MRIPVLVLILLIPSVFTATAQPQDWKEVLNILGRPGTESDGVLKVTYPRTDLHVTVNGVAIKPGLALTSWIAFAGSPDHAMAMGDLVLAEKEVAPAMAKLVDNGIDISALHNHILGESPRVMYMHFGAHGKAVNLARAMRAVLLVTGTPMSAGAGAMDSSSVNWSDVEALLGRKGHASGPLLQFGVPRAEKITENGMTIPPFMGMATGINIQEAGEKAVTTGDFVLLAKEVNPVIRALTSGGIAVTAVHNHMLSESPRLFFLHFWGYDTPKGLATALRSALDKTNSQKPS